MSGQPQRRRVPMPPPSAPPRVGKIRLGERYDSGRTNKAGESILLQRAIDYFRVDGEDEVTAPESAASFHEVYPDEPRALRCLIPGRRAEDVWEGAYRLYGARKLKHRCDGVTCDERSPTGGWVEQPCLCRSRMIEGVPLIEYRDPKSGYPHPDRCKLSWTLNVFLPDVIGVGVWQIQTGSEISVRRVSDWLRTMEALVGDLLMMEFTLNLVPEDVTPDGKTKEVWVLEPRAVTTTPAQLMAAHEERLAIEAGAPAGPVMPDPDDEPDVVVVDPDEGEGGVEAGEASSATPPPAPPHRAARAAHREAGRARMDELMEKHGLSEVEFVDVAHAVGEHLGLEVAPVHLIDDKVFEAVDAECKRRADLRTAMPKGRREPDDPPDEQPPDEQPLDGQGTML